MSIDLFGTTSQTAPARTATGRLFAWKDS